MSACEAPSASRNPIRVGIIGSRGIPNRHGGFERFVELLVEHSSWGGTPFHFVVYGEGPSAEYNSVTTTRQLPVRKADKGLEYYARSVLLASKECDIVVSLGVAVSFFAFIPLLRGKPLIVNPDGVEWMRSKWSSFGRFIIRMMYFPALLFSNRIVIDAEALRSDFPRIFRRKMTYIAYQAPQFGTATETAIPASLGIDGPFDLVIARLEPENNIEMILDGYQLAAETKRPLIVVGGTNTPFFRDRLKARQMRNIRFVGAIYDQSVLNALRQLCSAYIHGHSVGGTNPSLLEALATVKGRLLCHDNKYNREVARDRARFFCNVQQLSALLAATPTSVPDAAVQASVFDDERYQPSYIAERYREVLTEVSSAIR